LENISKGESAKTESAKVLIRKRIKRLLEAIRIYLTINDNILNYRVFVEIAREKDLKRIEVFLKEKL